MRRFLMVCTPVAVTAGVAISLGLAGGPPTVFGSSQPELQKGVLTVVFRWHNGSRELVGTARESSLAPRTHADLKKLQEVDGSRTPKEGEYEVWFLGEGISEGYCYDRARGVSAMIDGTGKCGPEATADGRLPKAVAAAAPAKPIPFESPPPSRATWIGHGPSLLEVLVGSSHIIVVGRVAGILRMNHTPVNHTGQQQHTVYAFAVERYLKTDRWGMASVRKIHQIGGTLPWKDAQTGEAGLGYRSLGNPPLQVGQRYILFLRWIGDGKGWPPFIWTEVDGVRGKVADMDEYEYTHGIRGKLLLKEGMTRPADLTGKPEFDNWTFVEGPQILNVPEAEAIQAIVAEVNRQPR